MKLIAFLLLSISAWAQSGVPILGTTARGSAGGGSFALVGTPQGAIGAANLTLATTTGMNITGANLLVCAAHYYVTNTASITSTSNATGWTGLTAYGTTSTNGFTRIFYKYSPTTSTSELFTLTLADGDYASLNCTAWSGASGSFLAGTDVGATGVIHPGSVTPATGNLVITSYTNGQGAGTAVTSVTSGANTFTSVAYEHDGNNVDGGIAYRIATGTTALDPSWTVTSGGTTVATSIAVFQ